MRTKKIKGKHFVFDLYGCDSHEIDSVDGLERLMREAADAAHMEILHVYMHRFTPHGVTGVAVLSTSHISVHTWPEYGYAAFDVFSCSDEARTRLAVDYIVKRLQYSRKRMHAIDRGYAELKTIDIPVCKNNSKRAVNVMKKVAEIKSPFQKIQVLDLEQFGRTLLIDGITQISVSDTHIYDEAITKPLKNTDVDILILGGGDGFVAKRVLESNPSARVTIVELDPEVVYCARAYFDQSALFENENVTLVIGDALQYLSVLSESGKTFDGIIVDLTDQPVGSGKALTKLKGFYTKLLDLTLPLLSKDGWISSQAGVKKVQRPLITTYEVLLPLFKDYLTDIQEEQVMIPSFLEKNTFLYGTRPR